MCLYARAAGGCSRGWASETISGYSPLPSSNSSSNSTSTSTNSIITSSSSNNNNNRCQDILRNLLYRRLLSYRYVACWWCVMLYVFVYVCCGLPLQRVSTCALFWRASFARRAQYSALFCQWFVFVHALMHCVV